MSTLGKPSWWNPFKTHFGFTDDGSPTIDSNTLLQTLSSSVTGRFSVLTSPGFMGTQLVVQDTAVDVKKGAILISSPSVASEIIGKNGVDYLSGSAADDIIYGGSGADYFMPRGGKDFIVGSVTKDANDRDTVSYETATAGIIVEYPGTITEPPPPPPPPANATYSASYTDFVAGKTLTINSFIKGPGGDVLNVYDLLRGAGYTGSNPIADGYIKLADLSSGMKIQFDADGKGKAYSALQAVVIKGVKVADFSVTDNLVTTAPTPVEQPPETQPPAQTTPPPTTTTTTTTVPPAATNYHAYYSASYADFAAGKTLTVNNFLKGPGGDIINVYDLLKSVGYTGTNPIADGYIKLADLSSGMKIQFDADGKGKAFSSVQAVVLKGVKVAEFSITDNLVTNAPAPSEQPPTASPLDYTIVSQDGHGGYDILYSVENIIGSNFNDVIHGRDDAANIIYGGAGNDQIYGEGGDDKLNGAQGDDTIYGGTGNDLILASGGNDTLYGGDGADTYKFGYDYLAANGPKSAAIMDFQAGDKVDVTELLKAVNYKGSDAFADGYVSIRQGASGAEITFDKDGANGPEQANVIATVNGVNAGGFATNNIATQTPTILFTAILGQSNASSLRVLGLDTESGVTRLEAGLKTQTNYDRIASVFKDENGTYIDVAVGGTVVNGDKNGDPAAVWWYPSQNKPGELAMRAADILITQIMELRSQGAVTPAIIWGQGESDAADIGAGATEAARLALQQTYYNATMSVFNYITERLGPDTQIYIMQTGNFHVGGATTAGVNQSLINNTVLGLNYIHDAQEQMALADKNIHLAVNYTDLPLLADMPNTTPGYDPSWASDQWHLDYDAKEVVGDRLGDFIALDLGYDHVIDNPGAYPMNMLSDLTIHDGQGLVINGNANHNIITGMTGNDVVHGYEGNDAIVTGAGNDVLYGDAGNDILMGGAGADTFVFNDAAALNGVDTIKDFNIAEADVLDISDILEGFDPAKCAIADFVQITEDGQGNSLVSVDADGAGVNHAFAQIATLSGVSGISDVQALIDSGHLKAITGTV